MKTILSRLRLGLVILLIGGGARAQPAPSPTPPAAPVPRADLAEARRLAEARDFSAADQLYERYLVQQPDDARAHFFYGLDLNLEAAAIDDPAAAAALRRRVREQMLTAQKLGSQEPLVSMVLNAINPDGTRKTEAQYSNDQAVNSLMKTAEEAFAKGDFARAADLHRQALLLEPRNYVAALYCGDAYFSAKDYVAAGRWFAKAVAINPDMETAHRYWADALERQGKTDAATSQYIEAVVAEPYNSLTRTRFQQYAEAAGLSLRAVPLPLPPAAVVTKEGKTEIQVAPNQGAVTLALAYATACAGVRAEDFGRLYPKEEKPRRSLPEEVAGLRMMLQVAKELAAGKPDEAVRAELARWQTSLDLLNKIQGDDLLEAFALLERADQDLAHDYPAYRAAHRDKLARFIRVYWCGLP